MNFSERLHVVMQHGNLTVADLARWFDRPHPTVRGWVQGSGLGGAYGDVQDILKQLGKLEMLIKKNKVLPVPRLSPRKRIAYLEKIRSA